MRWQPPSRTISPRNTIRPSNRDYESLAQFRYFDPRLDRRQHAEKGEKYSENYEGRSKYRAYQFAFLAADMRGDIIHIQRVDVSGS